MQVPAFQREKQVRSKSLSCKDLYRMEMVEETQLIA